MIGRWEDPDEIVLKRCQVRTFVHSAGVLIENIQMYEPGTVNPRTYLRQAATRAIKKSGAVTLPSDLT